ncbi:ribonuclease H-like domain-containing protein [Tanacetum coccineum]
MPSPSVSSFTFPSTTEPVFSASTSKPVFESPNHTQPSQTTQSQQLQQYHTTTVSNNNAKFPYLKKEEYETWAMKMEYWIMNSDHNLWNIVLNGNSRKRTGRDPKGNIMILPPVSVEEQIVVQRETKARTILLQSLPEDHMADFHHLDDARDIWLAVKARFGGNDESKKMRKSMLKQEFSEFRVSESEGLHKGYDRFQKILSQLNQMQAKPDNEDCNMKFLRALPPSWSQVAITLKTKGGLDYLSFDDLYNKLRTLEIDVKGGSSYDSRGTSAPTHSAFISAASTNSKMSYPDQSHSTTFTSTSSSPYLTSSNVMENVLHTFVAESDPRTADHIMKVKMWKMVLLKYNGMIAGAGEDACYKATVKLNVDILMLQLNFPLWGISSHAKLENMNEKVKLEESNARFDKWRESSKNLVKLINSSIEPLNNRFVKTIGMHLVPPPLTGTFMPPSNNPDIDDTQFTYGSKSNYYSESDSLMNKNLTSVPTVVRNRLQSVSAVGRNRPNSFPLAEPFTAGLRWSPVACAKASLEESTKWHRRMAHVNFKNMNKLAKHGLVNGLPSKLFTNEHNCVACNKGKQHKASYKAITADIITSLENQLTKKVKAIRYDNGTEFKNSKLIKLCGSKGIRRDYSNARTLQQNRVAKRKNRTLIEAARTMLVDSKLPTMELAYLKQAYEANATAEKNLSQADLATSRNRVPAGKVVSAAGVTEGPTDPPTPVFKPVHTAAPSLPLGVVVDSVPTKRVNTIHPQSQILRDLTSPVQTRVLAQALNDPSLYEAKQEEMPTIVNEEVGAFPHQMKKQLMDKMDSNNKREPENPFYLKKSQWIKPTLYDGIVISDKHVAMPVIDDEETLILEEESRSKMSEKEKDPEAIKQNISHKPIDYEKLNRLSDDFGKRFTPQQELSVEQAFWLHLSNPTSKPSDASPVKIEAPKELPKLSLVNKSLKKLKFHLARFDNVVKIRTTPDARTKGMLKLDLDPLAPKVLQNRDAHIDYLKQTQEQADILWGIVKQAKAKQPLDNALDFACKHAKQIQELLLYVQGTFPNAIKLSAKKVAVTPKNNVKKVRFAEPLTSSSNIKQVESSITLDSNTHVLSSTGLKCSTSNCGLKPTGNKKNDRIS